MVKKIVIIFFLMVSITALVACGKPEKSGKNLRVAVDVELASMDQHVATDGLSFDTISSTIEGLYGLDAAGNSVPAIALSHVVSDDELTYTFTLRDNAKWSNGDAVTANDFVFSWRRLVDSDTASEYSFIASVAGLKNADKILAGELTPDQLGVSATDDQTLVVELERPVPYFISLMSFSTFLPLNEAFVTAKGDQYGLTPSDLLANGPFKMVKWNKGYNFVLEKNKQYYDEASVKIDGLEFKVLKDPQTAVLEFESGNLDMVKLTGELVDLYSSNEAFTNIPLGYLWYMSPNQEVAELQNENMRLALAHAFNKAHIASTILNDGSIPADFIVPVGLATGPDGKDFRASAPKYLEYNATLAAEYWATAKSELGISSLSLEILYDDDEATKKVAEFLQAELQKLDGLSITLKSQPKKQRLQLMREGSYELGLTRWGPDYADPTTYLDLFLSDASNNYPNYSNAEYDSLVERAGKGDLTGQPVERWQALIDAEEVLLEEAGVIPMYQRGTAYLIRENVSGLETHVVGTTFVYKNVQMD